MKTTFTILTVLALILSACSTSSYVADDVYYAPGDQVRVHNKMARSNDRNAAETLKSAETGNFNAEQYTEPENVSAVSNGDTLSLDSFEYENGDRDVVVNNYYNTDYASRINRFYGPSVGLGYYSPYYDPFYYDPWYYGNSMYMGFNMGYGLGLGFGYGYPYYPSYGYGGCYSCYPYFSPFSGYYSGYNNGYYNGFYNGYYTGNGIIIDDGRYPNSYYGHRRNSSTARYNPVSAVSQKNAYSSTSTGRRRYGGTATTTTAATTKSAVTSTETTSTATQPSRRSTSTSGTRTANTRTIPQKSQQNNAQVNRRSYGTERAQSVSPSNVGTQTPARTGTSNTARKRTIPTTRVIPANHSGNKQATTNTGSSQRRYIPKYTNPKTNSKPSYNNSGSRSYSRSSATRKPTYSSSPASKSTYRSSPTRRSTYSTPSRSSSSRSYRSTSGSSFRSSGSSVRSSGSSVRSSGSTSRSSSSGSRSSGSSGRRK